MTTFKEAQRSRSKAVARSKRAPKVLTEDQEQITLMSWAHRVKFGNGRLSDYLIHIPNGGSRNIIEAAKFKQMGVRAGFPDLLMLIPNKYYPFMGIELKTKTGRQSDHQKAYQKEFDSIGAKYVVCRSLEEFIEVVNGYLAEI